MVKRLPNWPLLLSAFITSRKKTPFVWGKNDCLMFAADAVVAVTGVDPAAKWRGSYSSKDSASDLLKNSNGIEGYITEGLGVLPHNQIMKAARGDIALINGPEGLAAGVVDDSGQFIVALNAVAGSGIIKLPLRTALKIWSY